MTIKYSIVIPCFNEEKNLVELYESSFEHLVKNEIEVIIVNNGSTDNSKELMNNLEYKYQSRFLRGINLNSNLGYGGGILEGLKIANGVYIGWTHADLQTDIRDVLKGFKIMKSNQFLKGNRIGRPFKDNFFSYGMAIFESLILRKMLWEINAQPTLFSNEFFKTWKNPPNDFSLDLYAYYTAKKMNLQEKRIKVYFPERKHGSSSWNTGISSKLKLIRRTIEYSFALRKRI